MRGVTDPEQIEHPELREMARTGDRLDRLELALYEIGNVLGYFEGDGFEHSASAGVTTRDDLENGKAETPLEEAYGLVDEWIQQSEKRLELRLVEWLSRDPEHAKTFEVLILQPWLTPIGTWREQTPGWIRALCIDGANAHAQQVESGRPRFLQRWKAAGNLIG
jgi:hypothetical protein